MFEANGGGLLTVSSQLTELERPEQREAPEKRAIRVCIGDNGPGIPTELQAQIFDPFFTTKSLGKGTGLGLSVCHGIIGEHDGQIWVESTPGEGTRFYVQIPVVSFKDTDTGDTEGPQPALDKQGIGHLLVVEDDEAVRAMVVRVLEQAGYQVETSMDGLSALEKIGAADYDLIICDVRMPRLSGIDLYKRLSSVGSEAPGKFLFITGDTVSAETIGFIEANGISYLGKPFEIQDLLKAVKLELGQ
jgi:two-component system NtrC family sensor kinase